MERGSIVREVEENNSRVKEKKLIKARVCKADR